MRSKGDVVSQLCPAQAYPLPAFRFEHIASVAGINMDIFECFTLFELMIKLRSPALINDTFICTIHLFIGLDPVGSSVPNVQNKDIKMKLSLAGVDIGLTCEGQGYPTPHYRFSILIGKQLSVWGCPSL